MDIFNIITVKRLIYILFLFAAFAAKAQDIHSIGGTVRDEKGVPIPGAIIFLTNTKKATAADRSGSFILNDLTSGSYELAVKMIGFTPDVQIVRIQNKDITINIELKETNIDLNTVIIKGRRISESNQKKYMKLFVKNFIGESTNAGECEIVNPDVLSFNYDQKTDILKVNASDLLIIKNYALGYQVKYLLNEFRLSLKQGICFYTGYPYFEELSGNERQHKQWENNRRATYLGSSRHFFRSAMNNTAEQEGFAMYAYKSKLNRADSARENMHVLAPIRYLPFDSVFVTVKNTKVLLSKSLIDEFSSNGHDTTKSYLYVLYKYARQSESFLRTGEAIYLPIRLPSRYQISKIRTNADTIMINNELLLNPTKDFMFFGYWAWERIATLLPLEYFVDPIVKTKIKEPIIQDMVLRNKIAAIDSFHKRQLIEKLYLHLDKPYYAIGDTLRFKAYLLDESLSASLKSGIMYVELINDSNRVCKRQTILLSKGRTWGDIVIKKTWYPGNYTMRAYTNWMRNFGDEHFFTKQISIMPNNTQQWLVNEQVTIDKDKKVNVSLHFSDFNHKNIGFRDMELSVLAETKIALTVKAMTNAEGNLSTTFSIPEKLADKQLTLLAEDISKEGSVQKITLPIRFNRLENIDLQFMPEGGNLIAGIKTRVGFKAIGEDGKGKDISGKVYDSKQQEVAAFKATHLGMGNFELTPQQGESYTAKIDLPGGTSKSYVLPVINSSGIALRVNRKGDDSLEVVLSQKSEVKSPASTQDLNTYYLIGQARDKICYGAKIVFNDKTAIKKMMTSIFPTGIVKWVLLDVENHPVSQRMIFVNHNDLLKANINSNKGNCLPRDSIGLQIAVTDKNDNPVQGSFSLAVTDDNQVKAAGANSENIASYMLLNPDLKGIIEEPGYYFSKEDTEEAAALDNLLLTQGWVGYDWQQVFGPPVKPEYEAETEFMVKGRASNFFNGSVSNTEIYLISKKPELLFKTTTDKEGRFSFTDFPYLDTIDFRIQTQRKLNIGVKVNEFVPPEFTQVKMPTAPWFLDGDSTLINYANKKQEEQEDVFNAGKSKLLKEVDISGNRIEPPPLLHLDEEDIRNARIGKKPMNLRQLLDRDADLSQMDKRVMVDGQLLTHTGTRMGPPATNADIMAFLEEFTTEDIKAMSARKVYTDKKEFGGIGLAINISTNIKMGASVSPTGGYEYRPMPISWPHQFYSPRYTVKDIPLIKDRRSTIYWAPDITTDAYGKAEVSFYSADTSGTYSLVLEGCDLNGNLGYKRQQIKVVSTNTVNVK